ncbi:putative glycosyl transferase [Caloramator mitchellensis]|uniref:Putative glycosyl transferase n=1 Tax=Caloramator mitchellensis TaxID=908809 RepID=A0A0R3JR18_CALMK|nr:glycosyltransferase family 4 protein [Caloramator mitchellensis]KRQ85864.1 putative glycosyl transferase [Caloramator mitchellensis]
MNKKKEFLFLCQFFYPEYISSAALPFETAEALVNAGLSVGVLCGYPKEYSLSTDVPLKEIYKGIEIKRLRYIQLKRSNFIGRIINYFSFTLAVALNFLYLKNYKTIIVYSNPPILPLIAAAASKLFKTKFIFVCYDVYPEIAYITNSISEGSIIAKLMNFINKVVFKYVNKVVALSSEMKDFLLLNRQQLKEEKVEVIPNWYEAKEIQDISKSYFNKLFQDLKPKENLIVGYYGNLGICQDLDIILRAIRELRNFNGIKFVFAGHGNKMRILKSITKEEELSNVIIYDFLHGQDFQDALNITDCFIVSLVNGLTGLAVPSKTYSYMMAGKPIIAIMGENSDIARDLIENKAGFVIQPGETSKLIDALKDLYYNQEKIKIMGENCRDVFLKKYTKEKCTNQYVKLMKEILEDE